ncbi:unnamed protein product, partial [Mesorhabditis spiculigera]
MEEEEQTSFSNINNSDPEETPSPSSSKSGFPFEWLPVELREKVYAKTNLLEKVDLRRSGTMFADLKPLPFYANTKMDELTVTLAWENCPSSQDLRRQAGRQSVNIMLTDDFGPEVRVEYIYDAYGCEQSLTLCKACNLSYWCRSCRSCHGCYDAKTRCTATCRHQDGKQFDFVNRFTRTFPDFWSYTLSAHDRKVARHAKKLDFVHGPFRYYMDNWVAEFENEDNRPSEMDMEEQWGLDVIPTPAFASVALTGYEGEDPADYASFWRPLRNFPFLEFTIPDRENECWVAMWDEYDVFEQALIHCPPEAEQKRIIIAEQPDHHDVFADGVEFEAHVKDMLETLAPRIRAQTQAYRAVSTRTGVEGPTSTIASAFKKRRCIIILQNQGIEEAQAEIERYLGKGYILSDSWQTYEVGGMAENFTLRDR